MSGISGVSGDKKDGGRKTEIGDQRSEEWGQVSSCRSFGNAGELCHVELGIGECNHPHSRAGAPEDTEFRGNEGTWALEMLHEVDDGFAYMLLNVPPK